MGKGGERQPGPPSIGPARTSGQLGPKWQLTLLPAGLHQAAKHIWRPLTLDKKTAQIKHGGNLLFATASLKKAHFIKPSDIQRTAALKIKTAVLRWYIFYGITNPRRTTVFFFFRLRGGCFRLFCFSSLRAKLARSVYRFRESYY